MIACKGVLFLYRITDTQAVIPWMVSLTYLSALQYNCPRDFVPFSFHSIIPTRWYTACFHGASYYHLNILQMITSFTILITRQ